MGKLSPELLFALVICFICLPLLLADTSCPVVPGTTCSDVDDKDIMKCCLKNYKLGFETLPQEHIPKSQDPPSCKLDLVSLHLWKVMTKPPFLLSIPKIIVPLKITVIR